MWGPGPGGFWAGSLNAAATLICVENPTEMVAMRPFSCREFPSWDVVVPVSLWMFWCWEKGARQEVSPLGLLALL